MTNKLVNRSFEESFICSYDFGLKNLIRNENKYTVIGI